MKSAKPWPDIDFVQNAAGCNLTAVRALNVTVGVRELFAFTPWYYADGADPLIPAAAVATHLPMWAQLLQPDGFAAAWGLRSAERRHACYNYVSAFARELGSRRWHPLHCIHYRTDQTSLFVRSLARARAMADVGQELRRDGVCRARRALW